MTKKGKLFIVVNQDWFFLSHRLPIGIAAKEEDWDVTVVSEDTGMSYKITENGLRAVNLPINKAGTNLKDELKIKDSDYERVVFNEITKDVVKNAFNK